MSIKVCQREYFTEQLPEALPLAVLEDINQSFGFKYKLPKNEKKMRKAMRFAKTVYTKSMDTKFAKKSDILTYDKLEVDEVDLLKPLSSQLKFLFAMTDITLDMVEEATCIHVISNWTYAMKLPLSTSVPFMKGALNEKIKKLNQEAESAKLLQFKNSKLDKEEQDRIYKEIREKARAAKEADELAEKERAAKRRQAAVEMMDLDMILVKRVQKVSIAVPYVEGKSNLGHILLTSWQHQHLLDEACGGVYGLPERPELEIVEFEFRVFLPPPIERERMISVKFLFDRIKLMFVLSKKLEDRLLLYVHQGPRGNLWQHDITPLKSAVCRVGDEEFSTLDVFLQKSWRRLLIRHIAPLRTDPLRVAYIRDLREKIVYDGDVAMERDNVTPDHSASDDSSSSEDSRARIKRKKREKRLKKKKEEERKARKAAKKKKKSAPTDDSKVEDEDVKVDTKEQDMRNSGGMEGFVSSNGERRDSLSREDRDGEENEDDDGTGSLGTIDSIDSLEHISDLKVS
jgi:hypothetical protein